MNPPLITVSHNGEEKAVPLAVLPSLELSDMEVENALASLLKALRKSFNLHSDDTFYLYETETNRAMNQESFRDPNYCRTFPGHWYMVLDRLTGVSTDSPFIKHNKVSRKDRQDSVEYFSVLPMGLMDQVVREVSAELGHGPGS